LVHARAFYTPAGKIHTQVRYFEATEEEHVTKERWNDYCHNPIDSYQITGNHYSIFERPQVAEFAKIFDSVLKTHTNKYMKSMKRKSKRKIKKTKNRIAAYTKNEEDQEFLVETISDV
jgi:hypothetical protein